MADLFISYAHLDQEFAEFLRSSLAAQQHVIWIDKEDIPHASKWWREIQQGIDASDTVIYLMTQNSLSSAVCHAEIAYALKQNKRIIPLLREKPKPDEFLEELKQTATDVNDKERLEGKSLIETGRSNWFELSRINWIDFQENDARFSNLDALTNAVNTDLDYVKQHTWLNVRAVDWQQHRQNVSHLLRGMDLRDAETWFATSLNKTPKPTNLHRDYIFASRTAQARRQRIQFSAVSVALMVSTTLAFAAFLFARSSFRRANENASISLASGAQEALGRGDVDLAVTLALEANKLDEPPLRSQAALKSVAYSAGTRHIFEHGNRLLSDVVYSNDGKHIVTGDMYAGKAKVIIWNAYSGAQEHSIEVATAYKLAKIPNTDAILVAGFNEVSRLELSTGELTQIVRIDQSISSVAVAPDGASIAIGTTIGDIALVDTLLGRSIMPRLQAHHSAVTDLDFNLVDGNLYSSDADGLYIAWNIRTGEKLWQHDNQIEIKSLQVSPDGHSIIITDANGKLWKVDAQTGNTSYTFIEANTNFFSEVTYSHNGNYIAAGGSSTELYVWNTTTGEQLYRLAGHTAEIVSLEYSSDDSRLVTVAKDGNARLWQLQSLGETGKLGPQSSGSSSAALRPKTNEVAIGGYDGQITLYDVTSNQVVRHFAVHVGIVSSMRFSADGSQLLSCGEDGVRWWDVDTGTQLLQSEVMAGSWITDCALNADGKRASFATLNPDTSESHVILWDVEAWSQLHDFPLETNTYAFSVIFSPDGSAVIAGFGSVNNIFQDSADNSRFEIGGIISWDTSNGTQLTHQDFHSRAVYTVANSPDGNQFITGSGDHTAILRDVATQSFVRTFAGHSGRVTSIAFSSDGQYVLTGDSSGDVRLWDRSTGAQLVRYTGHTGRITDIVFLPNSTFLTVSADGTNRLWQLPLDFSALVSFIRENHYVRELTCDELLQFNMVGTCNPGESDTSSISTSTPIISAPKSNAVNPIVAVVAFNAAVTPTPTAQPTVTVDQLRTATSQLDFVPLIPNEVPDVNLIDTRVFDMTDSFVANIAKVSAPSGEKVLGLLVQYKGRAVTILQLGTSYKTIYEWAFKEYDGSTPKSPGKLTFVPYHGTFDYVVLQTNVSIFNVFIYHNTIVWVISEGTSESDMSAIGNVTLELIPDEAYMNSTSIVPTLSADNPLSDDALAAATKDLPFSPLIARSTSTLTLVDAFSGVMEAGPIGPKFVGTVLVLNYTGSDGDIAVYESAASYTDVHQMADTFGMSDLDKLTEFITVEGVEVFISKTDLPVPNSPIQCMFIVDGIEVRILTLNNTTSRAIIEELVLSLLQSRK